MENTEEISKIMIDCLEKDDDAYFKKHFKKIIKGSEFYLKYFEMFNHCFDYKAEKCALVWWEKLTRSQKREITHNIPEILSMASYHGWAKIWKEINGQLDKNKAMYPFLNSLATSILGGQDDMFDYLVEEYHNPGKPIPPNPLKVMGQDHYGLSFEYSDHLFLLKGDNDWERGKKIINIIDKIEDKKEREDILKVNILNFLWFDIKDENYTKEFFNNEVIKKEIKTFKPHIIKKHIIEILWHDKKTAISFLKILPNDLIKKISSEENEKYNYFDEECMSFSEGLIEQTWISVYKSHLN